MSMSLRTYLDKTQETIVGFAERVGISRPTVSRIWTEKFTPLMRTAVLIEQATDGAVNALDMIGTIEDYSPLDPEWRKWWESRPGKAARDAASPIPDRKPRARAA